MRFFDILKRARLTQEQECQIIFLNFVFWAAIRINITSGGPVDLVRIGGRSLNLKFHSLNAEISCCDLYWYCVWQCDRPFIIVKLLWKICMSCWNCVIRIDWNLFFHKDFMKRKMWIFCRTIKKNSNLYINNNIGNTKT